jgi:PAS domain S-box-containing protein
VQNDPATFDPDPRGVRLAETQVPDLAFRGLVANAYLEATLDCVVIADASGRVVEFNPAAERTFGYSRAEAVGRTLAELLVPPALRRRHSEAFARFVASDQRQRPGRRMQLAAMRSDGSEFPAELVLSRVDGEQVFVCGLLRDLSVGGGANEDLLRHAAEHAALRRVATLVANEARPAEVFAAVAEEVALTLEVPLSAVIRFEADGTAVQVGAWGDENPFPVGTSWLLDQHSVSGQVARTGEPARVDDYAAVPGAIASRLAREAGIQTAVGVPILVGGTPWGAMMVLSTLERPLGEGIDTRLGAFTELIATAIANTQARDDLRRLAEEQAALRRVAVLVARDADPSEVFDAVAREVSHIMGDAKIAVLRFDPNRRATNVGAFGDHPFTVGRQWTLDGPSVTAAVYDTGRPARIDDYSSLSGSIAAFAREVGLMSSVGTPIIVDGNVWGAISVISEDATLPAETEARLVAFSELVGTAISKTEARDALRRNEDLYRQAIAETGAVPYALEYETGSYSFMGEGIEELTGYRPDELDHEAFGRLVLETFLHGEQAALDPADASYRTRDGEFERWRADLRIRARDGTIRWLSDASVEILGDDGGSVGSIGMLQDITERMRTDEERLRLAAILETTTDVVTLADAEGRVVYINRAGRELLGLSASGQVSGLTLSTFQPAASAPTSSEAIQTAAREGVWSGESVLLSLDGREIPVSQVLLAHRDASGDVTFFSGIARDLTERLQLEERLRRTQEEQAALRRVATQVAEGATPSEVFAAVAEEVARLLDVPAISMIRYERDGSSTAIAVWGDRNPFGVGATFEPWPGVMQQVRLTGRPARLEDFAYSTGPTTQRLQEARIHSGLGVPITVDGRVWGTIIALATGGDSLPDGIAGRLSSFTDLVATAIANAEARDDLDVFAREQEALRRVATITAAGASPQDVFDAVVSEVRELLDLPVVALTRYEPDGMVLMMAAAGPHPFEKGTRWPLEGLPVASMVLERGEPAYLEEYVTEDPTTGPAIERAKVRSGLAVPIMVDNKVWGTISTASTDVPLRPDTEKRLVGFTELVATAVLNAQARDELSDLADEQAALRRVATLVAEGAGSPAIYDAICQETGPVIGATSVNLCHFTADRFNLTVGGWSTGDTHVPTGTRLPIEGGTINEIVYESGAHARVESYDDARGDLAELIRARGIRSEVAAPVIVDGQLWGSIIAGWDSDEAPPAGAERRLAGFAELVATAVSNALARSELVASRARIVTAADEARRRIERNLHDGIQQQLVSLQLELKTVDLGVPPELNHTHADIERVQGILETVLDDVREIAQGVHPATLSQWGLEPSLRTLARRSPVPVELEMDVRDRLPASIEIALYYVVSEALANVAKHARATHVMVSVTLTDGWLTATIRDDGIGGAGFGDGSGVAGLVDRVEALGGRLSLVSPPQHGTTITAALPLRDSPIDAT